MSPSFILASSSPRRKELLQKAGYQFEIIPSSIEEPLLNLTPVSLVKKLSELKAKTIAQHHPQRWVLGADTLVAYQGLILGKPKDLSQAQKTLCLLNGKTHLVHTAYSLLHQNQNITKAVTTKITFHKLDLQAIQDYVKNYRPLDKAGAYGIQELQSNWIQNIEGSYTNVVGLPMESLIETFTQLGIVPQ